ncbi:MAG TPA: glycosyltransferase family 87 protein, partial [Gemmataceae bacterium]|nr:glycosyltransferase family 87 protein [Gemmataceae bacterium]
ADSIYGWLEHSETYPEISGPLYPPIEAFYTYPLGLLKPFPAYRIAQAINLLLTFAVGFLVWMLTRGRIWAAVGVAAAVAWPGYYGALALAQNPLLTLTLLMLGWLLVSRNHPWLGGFVWGFLAFKPVWAAAFLLAPLLSGRWRVCVAMLLTAAGLVLLTLPFVGWRPWFDWLEIGRIASADYAMSENWIFLSRDLQGLPRRWLSFSDGNATNAGDPLINIIGWGLWLMVLAATIGVALWRRRQPAGTDGPAIAFLMLGAFWSCYHFMYYDVLTAMLPICLLCAEPGRFFRSASAARPGHGSWPWNIAVVATIALFLILPHVADSLELMTGKAHNLIHTPPIDALCLLALWALCGWRWLRQRNAVGANGAVSSKPTSIVAGPGADVLQVAAGADESQPIATDNIRIAKSEA